NGRIVPLDYQLKNGEQIEILTAKRGGPSLDGAHANLGYLRTSRARAKVRQWFKRQNREETVSQGRTILERELNRLGIPEVNYEKIARRFNYTRIDDFLAAIGRHDINIPKIISALNEIVATAEPDEKPEWDLPITRPPISTGHTDGIKIQGVGNLLTNLAQCCRPVPGDGAIVGYITMGRGVTIHRRECRNILRLGEIRRERLIEVDWDLRGNETYPVDVQIEAFDRPGLVRDITAIMANEKINLLAATVNTRKNENKALLLATLEITDMDQLSRVLARIEQLPNVIEAQRRR
ncbi:MAG: ACT domain-containing protein, partial [Anaerolineae bacterium]|nr:ACT domain-containing protein [Anaerolineae bacterium]